MGLEGWEEERKVGCFPKKCSSLVAARRWGLRRGKLAEKNNHGREIQEEAEEPEEPVAKLQELI